MNRVKFLLFDASRFLLYLGRSCSLGPHCLAILVLKWGSCHSIVAVSALRHEGMGLGVHIQVMHSNFSFQSVQVQALSLDKCTWSWTHCHDHNRHYVCGPRVSALLLVGSPSPPNRGTLVQITGLRVDLFYCMPSPCISTIPSPGSSQQFSATGHWTSAASACPVPASLSPGPRTTAAVG